MRNRLHTQRSFRVRGNPYYRLPSQHRVQRVHTQGSDPLHLTIQSDHSKCTKKYGQTAQPTVDSLSNKNLAAFRDIIINTQGSMLPFLNSLRHHQSLSTSGLRDVQPFEVSLKPTCNTKTQKRVCDLTQSTKLNDLKYLWKEPCTQSNKTTIEYDCMLRVYKGKQLGPKFSYDPRVKYESTIQPPKYDPKDIVCDRFRKEVKAKK